jgi:hypothetical protein
MTIRTEPLYNIEYADDTTLLADLALVTERAAKTTAAALARGGIAPPNATTQAQLAARLVELERRPWALVRRGKTTSPAFAAGTRTVCTYDTLTAGGDGTCWTPQLPTRLVAPIDGLYRIDATLVWPQATNRFGGIAFRKTTKAGVVGGWLRGASTGLNATFYLELSRSKLIPLAAGDYVEVFGELDQNATTAITPIVIDGEETMSAAIEWRRPLINTPGI